MSSPDQLLLALISGITRRHCGVAEVDDIDAAVAELRAVAGNRPDLLAEHAGVCLGFAETGTDALAPAYRAEAELARAAGADGAQIEQWAEVGRKRAEQARQNPRNGSSSYARPGLRMPGNRL
jgi:hypothetical protein